MTITSLHGDCLDLLPTLETGSVQALITSPPYFGLRSYAIPPSAWPAVEYAPLVGLPPVVVPPMVCQLGAEPDPLAYIGHLVHVFRLARPALRRDATLWVNLGDSYAQDAKWGGASGGKNETSAAGGLPRDRRLTGIPDKNLLGIPARAALALQADEWIWRNRVVWHAPNPMPESVRDRVTRSHEQILMFGNSPRYYYDADAIAETSLHAGKVVTLGEYSLSKRPADANDAKRSGNANVESVTVNPTRNKRSVWRVNTVPMPRHLRNGDEAHYAAWPPALVEVMIKAATANKACASCGAAWVRQVEREASAINLEEGARQQRRAAGALNGGTQRVTLGVTDQVRRRDLGFTPACACACAAARCVVLDPFAGTGTTGAVAEALGRDSVLIDLGYQALQAKRTDGIQIDMEALR